MNSQTDKMGYKSTHQVSAISCVVKNDVETTKLLMQVVVFQPASITLMSFLVVTEDKVLKFSPYIWVMYLFYHSIPTSEQFRHFQILSRWLHGLS